MNRYVNRSCFHTVLLLFFLFASDSHAGIYADSAHGDPTNGVKNRTTGFETGNCAHCHDQHASRLNTTNTPVSALRGISTASTEEDLCLDCHDAGGPATDDIDTVIGKTYSHPVADYAWKHTISDTVEKELHTATGNTAFQGTNRHVECSDCHNPHEIGDTDTKHTLNTNLTAGSDQLQGVWGIEPTTDVKWAVPTNFSQIDPATKEYQICFKCHSYYAFQDADGTTALTGPSGTTLTDQAKEFSKGNLSVHPVRVGLDNQTGSYAPKSLTASQMKASWNSAVGTQTMYCSDCHGTENTGSAQGPHGSTNTFMLKGESGASNNYAYWPANSAGDYFTLKRLVLNTGSDQNFILCKKCHSLYPGGTYKEKQAGGFYNYVHDKHYDKDFNSSYGGFSGNGNIPCVACHTPVVHGSQHSRLIGYVTDPAPYTVTIGGATFPVLKGFKKAIDPSSGSYPSNNGYDKENCWITGTTCGSHSATSYSFD